MEKQVGRSQRRHCIFESEKACGGALQKALIDIMPPWSDSWRAGGRVAGTEIPLNDVEDLGKDPQISGGHDSNLPLDHAAILTPAPHNRKNEEHNRRRVQHPSGYTPVPEPSTLPQSPSLDVHKREYLIRLVCHSSRWRILVECNSVCSESAAVLGHQS